LNRRYLVEIQEKIGDVTIPEEESNDALKEELKCPIMLSSSDSVMINLCWGSKRKLKF